MKNGESLYKMNLDGMQVKFIMGGRAKCLSGWGFYNIQSCYDKLYYILNGQMRVTVNGTTFIAGKGDLVLLPSNSLNSYEYEGNGEPLIKYWLHFSADCNGNDLMELIQLPYLINIGYNEQCRALLKQLIDLWPMNDTVSMFTQKVLLLDLLTLYLEQAHNTVTYEAYDPRIEKAIEYIQQNLSHQITSTELGQAAGLHPNYFIRLFKNQTGMSPIFYINDIRMNKAKELLRSTDFPVCDVSVMVGIPNYSYFSRQFKESVNFTPTEYRSMMQNEDRKNYPKIMQEKSVVLTT